MSSYVHQEHRENRQPRDKGSLDYFQIKILLQLEKKTFEKRSFSHPFNIHINIDQGSVYTQYKLETKTYTE